MAPPPVQPSCPSIRPDHREGSGRKDTGIENPVLQGIGLRLTAVYTNSYPGKVSSKSPARQNGLGSLTRLPKVLEGGAGGGFDEP